MQEEGDEETSEDDFGAPPLLSSAGSAESIQKEEEKVEEVEKIESDTAPEQVSEQEQDQEES